MIITTSVINFKFAVVEMFRSSGFMELNWQRDSLQMTYSNFSMSVDVIALEVLFIKFIKINVNIGNQNTIIPLSMHACIHSFIHSFLPSLLKKKKKKLEQPRNLSQHSMSLEIIFLQAE